MFTMGSHDPFGFLKHKLWPEERMGVKLSIWFPTTKSRESLWFPYVQVACYIPLKSSRWRLQLCFKLQFNQKSTHKVIKLQNRGNPDFRNFRTPTWKSWDKMTYMDVDPVARHIEYYRGKVLASLKFGLWWVLWIRVCPWLIHALKLF